MKTHLIPKKSPNKKICTFCKSEIKPNEKYFVEEGINKHLHSLIARKYCQKCYKKYGEKILSMPEK